ncbi:MAG TPA: ABC transporter substrate-binding protein [Stellaceae bacterium]|nr:ABC transporter substrate-binding protein [Stellaceae bacterium]
MPPITKPVHHCNADHPEARTRQNRYFFSTLLVVKANGDPVNVDYVMRRNGDSWLISDIYLDGAISEVATRRSEFAAILKSQGIDGLIAALNRKADILTATTAKVS